MCLDARYPKIFCFKRTIGYKIVTRFPEIPGEYKGLYRANHYTEGKWNTANNEILEANTLLGYIKYPSGFHIYLNRKKTIKYYENCRILQSNYLLDFNNACVVKVEFTNVCAFGSNDGMSTIIAKKMKVIERIA